MKSVLFVLYIFLFLSFFHEKHPHDVVRHNTLLFPSRTHHRDLFSLHINATHSVNLTLQAAPQRTCIISASSETPSVAVAHKFSVHQHDTRHYKKNKNKQRQQRMIVLSPHKHESSLPYVSKPNSMSASWARQQRRRHTSRTSTCPLYSLYVSVRLGEQEELAITRR